MPVGQEGSCELAVATFKGLLELSIEACMVEFIRELFEIYPVPDETRELVIGVPRGKLELGIETLLAEYGVDKVTLPEETRELEIAVPEEMRELMLELEA